MMMMIKSKKPYLAVILIQSILTGMALLSKAAFNGGMNSLIFIFYRQAASTLFLVPLALFLEWKTAPPLSFVTFCKIFVISLFGLTISLNLHGMALNDTSATLVAATTNSLPVITFFLALLLGKEVLRLKTIPGRAKLVGIFICIGGVIILAIYKGPHTKHICHHHIYGFDHHNQDVEKHNGNVSSTKTWIKGCILMLTSNTLWGMWLIMQVHLLKCYPSKLLFTTIVSLGSTVQSFVIAVAVKRDFNDWKLGLNVTLVAIIYCGFVVTGVCFYLQAWVIENKGPVFLAMSTPLNLIFTILFSAFILCEIVTLESVFGGILLIAGLYSVLWGKSREQKIDDDHKNCLPTTDQLNHVCT